MKPILKNYRTKLTGAVSALPVTSLATLAQNNPEQAVQLLSSFGVPLTLAQLAIAALIWYFRSEAKETVTIEGLAKEIDKVEPEKDEG